MFELMTNMVVLQAGGEGPASPFRVTHRPKQESYRRPELDP